MMETCETSPEAVERFGNWIAHNASPTGIDLWNDAYNALSDEMEAGKVERGTLIQALKDGGEIQRIAIARAEAAEAERDALKAELAEAVVARDDAIDTLSAWFDRRELAHDAIDETVLNAARGYLRTSRSGGMDQETSDVIEGVIEDMARLSVFADLFARAALRALEQGSR